MLDIARVIYEKQQSHSIEEVDVITALADISLERGIGYIVQPSCKIFFSLFSSGFWELSFFFVRNTSSRCWFSLMKVQLFLALHTEDFEMCFQDYMKALEIMEGLVESDHRGIAEMYPYC